MEPKLNLEPLWIICLKAIHFLWVYTVWCGKHSIEFYISQVVIYFRSYTVYQGVSCRNLKISIACSFIQYCVVSMLLIWSLQLNSKRVKRKSYLSRTPSLAFTGPPWILIYFYFLLENTLLPLVKADIRAFSVTPLTL